MIPQKCRRERANYPSGHQEPPEGFDAVKAYPDLCPRKMLNRGVDLCKAIQSGGPKAFRAVVGEG